MTLGPCLPDGDVERLASGLPDARAQAHADACEACRARVSAAREDDAFLKRISPLAGESLGPIGAPRLPGYRIVRELSAGAQGIVYQAVQESTLRTVAIKTLGPSTGSARQRARAEREAEIVARLDHPNVVSVYESRSLADGRIAVVMEYIDGVPMDRWSPPAPDALQRRREVLTAFIAVCAGVHHAHLNGVIHRDLKPDNILVTREGRPVVVDFGIAKADGGLQTTIVGEFAGTPAYASPEQAQGRPDQVDALTDVYSLGVILYRLLTGVLPYDLEGSMFEMARTIAEAEPVRLRLRDPSLDADLEAIVGRAMAKRREHRYQSAAGLARDLERALHGEPVDARSGSGWYLLRKAVAVNRSRLAWTLALAVLILAAGGAVTWSLLSAADAEQRTALQRRLAREERTRSRAVTEVLREAVPAADPLRPEIARELGAGLDRLYLRLETGEFAADPELDQAVRRLWGEVYTGLSSGRAESMVQYAEVSLRSGLVRLREEEGEDHPGIADTMHQLAAVLLVRRRYPEAESYCLDALHRREQSAGPGSEGVAHSRALLARILLAENRPAEAVEQAQQVINQYGGEIARPTCAAMRALQGHVRADAGDWTAAEPLVLESLRERLKVLRAVDPEVLASLTDAARVADALPQGPLAAALRTAWPDQPGPGLRADLPILAAPDRGGINAVVPSGRTAALGRLVVLHRALAGEDDPSQVRTLMAQMRAAQAEGLPRERANAGLLAAEVLSKHFGPQSTQVLVCLEESGIILAMSGDEGRALEIGRRALAIRRASSDGARDPMLDAGSVRYLAWYLTLAGRYDEAAQTWAEATQELESAVGTEHHAVAVTRSGLAFCLESLAEATAGDIAADYRARAEAHSAWSLDTARKSPATALDQIAMIKFIRGHILVRRGQFAEARELLGPAWNIFICGAPAEFAWRRVYIDDMARACRGVGDEAAAAAWESQLLTPPPQACEFKVPGAG